MLLSSATASVCVLYMVTFEVICTAPFEKSADMALAVSTLLGFGAPIQSSKALLAALKLESGGLGDSVQPGRSVPTRLMCWAAERSVTVLATAAVAAPAALAPHGGGAETDARPSRQQRGSPLAVHCVSPDLARTLRGNGGG